MPVWSTALVPVPGRVATVCQAPVVPAKRSTTYADTPEDSDGVHARSTAPWAAGVAVSPLAGRGAWAPASGMAYAVPLEPTIEISRLPLIGPACIGSLVRSIVAVRLGCTYIVCRRLLWNWAETPELPTTAT